MFQNLIGVIRIEAKNPGLYSMLVLVFLFCVIGFFDKALAVGLVLLLFFGIMTVLFFRRAGLEDKKISKVFFMALLVHLGAALFIYYGHFKPFGGGADYTSYHSTATELASRFSQWNFSLAGLYTEHFFPVLIGILYMFTLSSMIIGQFFAAWLAAISVALVYVTVLEIGGKEKTAFLASLIATLYPSYLFFGSVLLKDTVVTPLVLLGLLLTLKIAKHFSWPKFLLFFVVLTSLINLRFYIGYALLLSFIISWPLLSAFVARKKILYWVAMIFLLGFSPQIVGNGYYASGSFAKFLNPQEITYFREVVYVDKPLESTSSEPVTPEASIAPAPEINNGNGSTFVLDTGFDDGVFVFAKNYTQSFTYSLLGPFPWQFRYKRQLAGLIETIPWYLLISFFVYGLVVFMRRRGVLELLKRHKYALPLLVFSAMSLGALSLFINNYGIIVRIRIPIFISLISVMCLIFDNSENYEKVSYYWRKWVHRLPFIKGTSPSGE